MSDATAPAGSSAGIGRFSVPDPAGLVAEFLGSLAGQFLDTASDARKADVLGELLSALRLHDGVSRGAYPPRGTVPRRSAALAGIEATVASAVRFHRAKAAAAAAGSPISPSAVPARLEVPVAPVEGDSQGGALLASDEVTLAEAALSLGVSSERARVLIHSGQITGWQEAGGRRKWHVSRLSVAAYRERRDGYGFGGSEQPVA